MQTPVDVIIPGELPPGETFADALIRHPERDILILESGTIDDERLARLAACARRESSVATLGVFADAGPIAYDVGTSERGFDRFFAQENAGIGIEVPSAFPPCTYITRRALDECGGLESAEPSALLAFCRRATDSGLRHLLCAEIYLPSTRAHNDGVTKWQAALENDPILDGEWKEFRQRAPATPLRRRVDLARLRASSRPRVLFVSHAWGGGVELHLQDLSRLLADDCEVLVLRPSHSGRVHLEWLREGEAMEAWFESADQWGDLVALLRWIGIARVHLHHVHGQPREALDLPRELGAPFDVTLHDHFAICPQYHLADENGRYCGEPDERGCASCLAKRPAQWGLDIAAWRTLFHRTLREAARVIVPTADIGTRVQRYFPDVQVQVWPHPEMRAPAPEVHKILVLGGLSAIKGMDLFEECVRDAAARRLSLHFQVLGHISRPLEVPADAPVSVLGSYSDARLARQVALERPDAFLFLSQVPETYSYTLSVAMQSAKPIVATQLGAFAERLRGYPAAGLVPHDASARAVNDTLLRLLQAPANTQAARPIPVSLQR